MLQKCLKIGVGRRSKLPKGGVGRERCLGDGGNSTKKLYLCNCEKICSCHLLSRGAVAECAGLGIFFDIKQLFYELDYDSVDAFGRLPFGLYSERSVDW